MCSYTNAAIETSNEKKKKKKNKQKIKNKNLKNKKYIQRYKTLQMKNMYTFVTRKSNEMLQYVVRAFKIAKKNHNLIKMRSLNPNRILNTPY